MRRRTCGFTLIELMVVVVIIGILAVFLLPSVIGRSDKAYADATKGIISKISQKIDLFKMDHNKYPSKLEDLFMMPSWVKPKDWPEGGYVQKKEELEDAWGNALVYRRPGTGGARYDLISFGADEKEGGDGVNEDIWNHDRH